MHTNYSVAVRLLLLFILGVSFAALDWPHPATAQFTPTQISSDITQNTTWNLSGSPYIVNGTVTVESNVTLTIEAGVVVKFAGGSLWLADGAILGATGSAAQPIVFTSSKDDTYGGDTNGDGQATLPIPGDWSTLGGYSTNSTLLLSHVLIRYGGTVMAYGDLELSDSTIEYSNGDGIYAQWQHESTAITIQRNTIRNNGNHGLYLYGAAASVTIRDNSFSGNGYHSISLTAFTESATADITGNTITLSGTGSSARGIYLQGNATTVTIANNTITRAANSSAFAGVELLNAKPNLTGNTVLNFTVAVQISGGYPVDVPVYTSNTFHENHYANVVAVSGEVLGGTWTNVGGYTHIVYNTVAIANGNNLTIPAGTILKIAEAGAISLGTGARLTAVGTAAQPIVITSIKDDTYGGDTNGDNQGTLPTAGDWYYLSGSGGASTLELVHTLVRYGSSGTISAYGNLTLQDSTIEQSNGDAVYVNPYQLPSPAIMLERNTIQNNGSNGIYVYQQPETLVIRNNTLVNNGMAGIYLHDLTSGQVTENAITVVGPYNGARALLLNNTDAGVTISNNTMLRDPNGKAFTAIEVFKATATITNNQVQGFTVPLLINQGYPLHVPQLSGNTFDGNRYRNSIGISGEIMSGAWQTLDGYTPFFVGYTMLVDGAQLTIPAGSVIKFDDSASLTLGTGAQVIAVGTAGAPIVFTSMKDDSHGGDTNGDGQSTVPQPGDWRHIQGGGAASLLQMEHVRLRYGTNALDVAGNLTLLDSIVEHNAYVGIYLASNATVASTVRIERTLIRHHSTIGVSIYQTPATLIFTGNALIDNQSYALENIDSNNPINATGNWWGSPAGPEANTVNRVSEGVNFTNWLTSEPNFVPIERPKPSTDTPASTPDGFEANNDCNQASTLTVDDAFQEHTFHAPGDIDWLRFAANAGETYRIEVQTHATSLADVNLEVYTTCDTAPAESWQATFTPGVRLDFQAPQAGTVYLRLNNDEANVYGANVSYLVSVRRLKASTEAKGALILMAGRLKLVDRLQPNIHRVTNTVYDLFKADGYSDDNIYYLATDNTLPGWDAPATLANLQNAITNWAATRVGPGRPLTLYLMDHGGIDTLYVDGANSQQLTPADLHSWLNQLETAVSNLRITVIVEACHSGSFIEGNESVSKPGRMIITSTNVQNVAYASASGAQFSDRFLTSLREGYGIYNSFWDAQFSVRRLYSIQEPWIDVNGNGVPNESEDGLEASQHNPQTGDTPADTWAPYIVSALGPTAIAEGQGMIRAEVRDNKEVKRVWAVVYPPHYRAPESAEELVPEDAPTINFTANSNHQFSALYDNFSEKGRYRVALYAEDDAGLKARLVVLEIDVGTTATVYLPLIAK